MQDGGWYLATYSTIVMLGIAPCTGTAVRGGLNFREANYVAEAVYETGRLGSFDIVEVNPHLTSQENVSNAIFYFMCVPGYFSVCISDTFRFDICLYTLG